MRSGAARGSPPPNPELAHMNTFAPRSADGHAQVLPGISQKTLIYGDKTLMAEFRLQAGSQLPEHAHPYEQTGYLVAGHIRLRIGDAIQDVRPGDAWCIPMNAPHGAQIVADSTAIEVFAPRRDDYVPPAKRN